LIFIIELLELFPDWLKLGVFLFYSHICAFVLMFWYNGEQLKKFVESDGFSDANNWCYFCNSKEHTGRQCELQRKVITPELLTEQVIEQWSESDVGEFNEGDDAPDCTLIDPCTKESISLHSFFDENIPTILNFGSYS